jgi:hypothetical protein
MLTRSNNRNTGPLEIEHPRGALDHLAGDCHRGSRGGRWGVPDVQRALGRREGEVVERLPSRPTAWARTPAKPCPTSPAASSGTSRAPAATSAAGETERRNSPALNLQKRPSILHVPGHASVASRSSPRTVRRR